MCFAQQAVIDVVHESTDVLLVNDEGTQFEASHVLDHALIRIAERLECPPRSHTALRFDLVFEFVFGDALKAAVGVVDEHDLSSLEATLRDDEGADDIVRDHAASIANDVSLTVGEPEDLEDVHTTVHARHDSHVPARNERETLVGKRRGELAVEAEKFVGAGLEVVARRHGSILPGSFHRIGISFNPAEPQVVSIHDL